jgi:hypothetical protein
MHRIGVPLLCAALLLSIWAGNAAALEQKKIVSTETLTGPAVKCGKWGSIQLRVKLAKTEVTGAGKPRVSIRILTVTWPQSPDRTPESRYLNVLALGYLKQETLKLRTPVASKLENVSGATQTAGCWRESLQAALVRALEP